MKTVHKTLRLTSPEGYGSRVPPGEFGHVLQLIAPSIRQAVRMAFQGRSVAQGRKPNWLAASADVRFVGLSGNRDTILNFEAPMLGEAAPELYQQQEFSFADTRPSLEYTAFDLFNGVLEDIADNNKDSDRFDRRLLLQVTRFGPAFGHAFDSLSVGDARRKSDRAALNFKTIEIAGSLRSETPKPRRVRVVGKLDMIRKSTSGFALHLDDGAEVRGVYVVGNMDELASLFGQRVAVEGRAVYRPSGRPLRIDAEHVSSGDGQPSFWSRVPPPLNRKLDLRELRKPQTAGRGIPAVWGKWPGNETDEEWNAMLERLS